MSKIQDPFQEIRNRIDYFYRQIDGTYNFPNSAEGDLLSMMHKALASKGYGKISTVALSGHSESKTDTLARRS
jgi:hypothetical protein